MTDQQFPPSSTGPVTFDDVAHALGDLDPGSTNAAKLRETLGRGSFATIQKHQDRLRATRAAQEPAPGSDVPSAPADVLATLWSAAYRAASHLTAARLSEALIERDQLQIAGAVASADVAALAGEVDALETAISAAVAAQVRAETEGAQAVQALASAGAASAVQMAELARTADTDLSELQHELALEQRDRLIERQTQQTTIDRLTDQIAELKALVALQARPTA